jgi:hypothetical protein
MVKVKARNGAILVYISPIVTEDSNLKDFLVFFKGFKLGFFSINLYYV